MKAENVQKMNKMLVEWDRWRTLREDGLAFLGHGGYVGFGSNSFLPTESLPTSVWGDFVKGIVSTAATHMAMIANDLKELALQE
jgi:hypothetical protein